MHWPFFSPQWDSKQKCVPGLFSWADVTPVRLARGYRPDPLLSEALLPQSSEKGLGFTLLYILFQSKDFAVSLPFIVLGPQRVVGRALSSSKSRNEMCITELALPLIDAGPHQVIFLPLTQLLQRRAKERAIWPIFP